MLGFWLSTDFRPLEVLQKLFQMLHDFHLIFLIYNFQLIQVLPKAKLISLSSLKYTN